MHSFLLQGAQFTVTARPRPEDAYTFFTYKGSKPVVVNYRGTDYQIEKGSRFGVRPSRNGKFIRLIFPNDPNRVLTIDPDTANKLARGVK